MKPTSAAHATRDWSLVDPQVKPNQTSPYYVTHLKAAVGVSWVFAVHFDDACKATQLRNLAQGAVWEPSTAVSRQTIQTFLIANKATFKLKLIQTGPEDADLKAALDGTTCSPSDLAACETLFTKVEAAKKKLMSAPLTDADYTKLLSDGHVGPWIICQVEAAPAAQFK